MCAITRTELAISDVQSLMYVFGFCSVCLIKGFLRVICTSQSVSQSAVCMLTDLNLNTTLSYAEGTDISTTKALV